MIVTRYVPAVVEVKIQDEETVAFTVMLTAAAGQVTARPVVGLVTEDNAIVPAKLLTLVIERDIAAPVAPELKLTGVPTLTVKSPICTSELAE